MKMKGKAVEKEKFIILLAGFAIIMGILLPSWLSRNRAENQKQMEEGRTLRMAVSTLFQEKISEGEGEMMDFCTEVYWLDIGDENHPLFGYCPNSWESKGKITGMVVTDDGELREIVYQSPDGSEEVWTMTLENGHLKVNVDYNE